MSRYEEGKVKVVWVKDEPSRIYSKKFDDETDALDYAESLQDYIVFSSVDHKNNKELEWTIMPLGRYKLYLKLLKLFKGDRNGIVRIVEDVL